MNLNFEIPLKRQPKQEKYSFPVLTMQRQPEEKGGARRFLLNKAAFELLGLNSDKQVDETLSVGFPQNNNGNFVVAVTTNNVNIPDKFKYMLHKSNNSFSDKTLYEAIQRELSLDNSQDVEFEITNNNGIFTLNLLKEKNVEEIAHFEKTMSEIKHEEAETIEQEEELQLKLD